jgi:transcriptional regulator with XRE-family HTH domain
MNPGKALRAWRGWHDLTQSDVASGMQACGHSWVRTTVSKIEHGHQELTFAEFISLTRILNVSEEAFITKAKEHSK